MKSRLTWVIAPMLGLLMGFSYAQEISVSGRVTDQTGLPLPGVNIVVEGTTIGTQSDFDGNYV
ncbi:MAG TPA: carboxypeptidase-like regulatory domain-containing protein, partial [Arenibacter sp.]|nr:carboxypeptidase-like regulatory domain-containing protein [Arenibacter sp.]